MRAGDIRSPIRSMSGRRRSMTARGRFDHAMWNVLSTSVAERHCADANVFTSNKKPGSSDPGLSVDADCS
jgi:hypothetical protein